MITIFERQFLFVVVVVWCISCVCDTCPKIMYYSLIVYFTRHML